MKRPSMQIAIPTVFAAILAGFVAVQMNGRSWLWVGLMVGAVVGWVIANWEHFYLNQVLGWSKRIDRKIANKSEPQI